MYDAVRVREYYDWYSPIKFFDTMSAHIVTSGFAGAQRYISVLREKMPEKLSIKERKILSEAPEWSYKGATNSLVAVYNYHVASVYDWFGENQEEPLEEADKKIRNVFVVTKSMEDFVAMGDFRLQLVSYASHDTFYTARIFRHLFPKYLEHKPSPVNLSGHLALSTARVPVVDDWFEWIDNCEELLRIDEEKVSNLLHQECQQVIQRWLSGDLSVTEDVFYSQLDWAVKRRKTPKGFEPFGESADKKWSYVPNWYYPMWKDPSLTISTKADISHILLRIHWKGFPIFKIKDKGWVFYPNGLDGKFTKIPHKENPGENVGSVLSKQFLDEMQDGTITGDHPLTSTIFDIAIRDSFWISARSRVKERIVGKSHTKDGHPFLMIVPSYAVNGTITGRSVENLFLTLSSIKSNKIGRSVPM